MHPYVYTDEITVANVISVAALARPKSRLPDGPCGRDDDKHELCAGPPSSKREVFLEVIASGFVIQKERNVSHVTFDLLPTLIWEVLFDELQGDDPVFGRFFRRVTCCIILWQTHATVRGCIPTIERHGTTCRVDVSQ